MGAYAAGQMIKAMLQRGIQVLNARVLVMGLTFKENCPDLRNTGAIKLIRELQDYGVSVDVHDPWADPDEARNEFGLALVRSPAPAHYDGIVLAVAHDRFRALGPDGVRAFGKPGHLLYDLKHAFPVDQSDIRL
jgi:UDP-N-acetyl-D-galactosamine dehydrogenase